jgi:hypothetical protein
MWVGGMSKKRTAPPQLEEAKHSPRKQSLGWEGWLVEVSRSASWSCNNHCHKLGGWKQNNSILTRFRRYEVQTQVVSRVCSFRWLWESCFSLWWSSSHWPSLPCRCISQSLSASSHDFLCVSVSLSSLFSFCFFGHTHFPYSFNLFHLIYTYRFIFLWWHQRLNSEPCVC